MFIKNYIYRASDSLLNGAFIDRTVDRNKYTNNVLGAEVLAYLKNIKTVGKCALLYAAGPASHHSDIRNVGDTAVTGVVAVKSQLGYSAYGIAKLIPCEIDFVSINANTCASSMYSLYEAKSLIAKGYTDVIIFSTDLVDDAQKLLFSQLGIDIICGDGTAVMHITSEKTSIEIPEVVWSWNLDPSPMSVSAKGYGKVLTMLNTYNVDIIKSHGSGTSRNTEEELAAINDAIPGVSIIEYKSKIGHTQGVSSLIELCMLIDNESWNNAICLASGLGGFYGGCRVTR